MKKPIKNKVKVGDILITNKTGYDLLKCKTVVVKSINDGSDYEDYAHEIHNPSSFPLFKVNVEMWPGELSHSWFDSIAKAEGK